MVLVMVCQIVFPANERRQEIVIRKVSNIEFEESFKESVSRGFIDLPIRKRLGVFESISQNIMVGDSIEVYFGYNKKLIKEFSGYISRFEHDNQIRLHFENEMYIIKRKYVNQSYQEIELKQLLKNLLPEYNIVAPEGVKLERIRFSDTQMGAVIEKIRESLGFYTWVEDRTVYCGVYYASRSDLQTVNFILERNCVSSTLNKVLGDDKQIKVQVIHQDKFGKKIESEVYGDKYGELVKIKLNNLLLNENIEAIVKKEYQRLKKDKLEGEITAFGIQSVRHGMKVNLISKLTKGVNGVYYIESVRKEFNVNGIRQYIKLGVEYKEGGVNI